jgi:hypothetical protein
MPANLPAAVVDQTERAVRITAAESPAQACAAARAVFEARLIVTAAQRDGADVDEALHALQMALYREADRLKKAKARK